VTQSVVPLKQQKHVNKCVVQTVKIAVFFSELFATLQIIRTAGQAPPYIL
jgi:hypothetical protein